MMLDFVLVSLSSLSSLTSLSSLSISPRLSLLILLLPSPYTNITTQHIHQHAHKHKKAEPLSDSA